MKKLIALLLGVAVLASVIVPTVGTTRTAEAQDATIYDTLLTATVDVNGTTETFTVLGTVVSLAGLDSVLGDPAGEFTVFAPVDSAFAALPELVTGYVVANPELLTALLTYHVVPGKVMAADVVAQAEANGGVFEATTVQGGTITIHVDEMGVRVNGANVVATDIEASNGVIHAIDAIIFPEITLPEVNPAEVSGPITTIGSSTVGPLSVDIANRWQEDGAVDVPTVEQPGTGGGFEAFCAGESDIANASRAIKQEEIDICTAAGIIPLEFRVGTDALAVVVSSQNDFVEDLTLEQVAAIFSGDAVTWADVNPDWPAEEIQRFSPGTDSGTFDYFVEKVYEKDEARLLNAPNLQLSEDDNVLVEGVANDPYAIGYFGYAYYQENRDTLRAASLEGVVPSEATVENGSYPFARPLFIYSDPAIFATKPQVAAFVNYYLTIVLEEIADVGYFPPSQDALNASRVIWLAATAGLQ